MMNSIIAQKNIFISNDINYIIRYIKISDIPNNLYT